MCGIFFKQNFIFKIKGSLQDDTLINTPATQPLFFCLAPVICSLCNVIDRMAAAEWWVTQGLLYCCFSLNFFL